MIDYDSYAYNGLGGKLSFQIRVSEFFLGLDSIKFDDANFPEGLFEESQLFPNNIGGRLKQPRK